MTYTKYTAVYGDRWDTIAYKAYGDPMKMGTIIEANPRVPKSALVPEGTILYIPVKDRDSVNVTSLPPWKR